MDTRDRTRLPRHTTPTMDLELDQPSLLPELSLSGHGAFSRWSGHSMVTASRNSMNPDVQRLPEHANGAILYGVNRYNGSRIQRAQDIQVATTGNPCSYLTSPYGTQQFPSPRSGLIGNPADAYARNSHFMEVGFPYKRRFSEGVPVNFQGPNSLASSESFNGPFNPVHGHLPSHLTRGDLMVQPFQPASNALRLDQPVNFNFDDRSAWTWNQTPAGFTIHGDNGIRGSSESFSSGLHRYSEISGMSSPNFQHPPSTMIQHSSHRIPLQQVHLHPQAAAAAIPRVRLSSAYGIVHQQFMELEPRQTSDLPFSGRIAYNPHQGCIDPETMFRRRSTSQMRVPEEDEVPFRVVQASASASNSNDIGEFSDAYRDMRLDIEHMSYEELLALEERIGYVRTGLSEETITSQLKTRISMPSSRESRNEEPVSCTICLDTLNDGKIGILDCNHYYHADCLKQWLLVKNVCPICKSEALTRWVNSD
ncbi:putative E3 ubiquitin-protein ligase HIP1, partial [Cucurbita argyrosperma subsp. sororia]